MAHHHHHCDSNKDADGVFALIECIFMMVMKSAKKSVRTKKGGWGGGRQELPTIFYMSEQHDNDLTIQKMSLESIVLL